VWVEPTTDGAGVANRILRMEGSHERLLDQVTPRMRVALHFRDVARDLVGMVEVYTLPVERHDGTPLPSALAILLGRAAPNAPRERGF
jgi:hypothetical protein